MSFALSAMMEEQEFIFDHSSEQGEERSVQPQGGKSQCFGRSAALLQARERLVAFMGGLGEHRKSEIREDVLAHCEQVNRSKRVVAAYISDETVLRLVGGRIDKMLKNKKLKKNWSEEDVRILVWVVSKYCDQRGIACLEKQLGAEEWEEIARLIPGVTGHSCMFKWLSIRKTNLSNCAWSAEESALLRQVIAEQQTASVDEFTHLNWKCVAEQLYSRNPAPARVFRSSKQCRQHWNCFLNPRLKKGPWLLSEDVQLLTLIKNNHGSKKWSEIVACFHGRTENALKNRYTLLLDKQRRISKSKQEVALIDDCLERYYELQMRQNGLDGQQVVLQPIVDIRDQVDLKESSSMVDSTEKESEVGRSEANTVASPTRLQQTSSPAKSVPKIHYLSSSDQLEFLEWIKRRSDIRRCCLKNGSLQLEDC